MRKLVEEVRNQQCPSAGLISLLKISWSHFQFGCLLFLLLIWSLWLGLPVLCWIRVAKADILVFFLILREILLVFFPLSKMLAVGLSYMAFIMLRNAPPIPTLLSVFIINGCWNFSIYWYDHVVFVFRIVHMMYPIYWFCVCTILISLGWILLDHSVWSF